MRSLLLIGLGLIALAVTGCEVADTLEGKRTVTAEYYPQGKKILVVPFRDPVMPYFESAEGSEVADYASHYMMAWRVAPVEAERSIPQGEMLTYIDANAKANELGASDPKGERMRIEALLAIAKNMNCELLLVGQIHHFGRQNPLDQGIVRGRLVMSAQLYDVGTGNVEWQMNRREVFYPDGMEYAHGVPQDDLPGRSLERALVRQAGEYISQRFHDHRVGR